jgi:hypothetical protein
MAEYDRSNFDHRAAVTGLRVEAIKQIIILALALVAVPSSIVGLGMQPNLGTAASILYWTFNVLGMLVALGSVGSGGLFLLSAPNWAKNKDEREAILDWTYVLAPVLMFISATLLVIGTLVAVLSKFLCP